MQLIGRNWYLCIVSALLGSFMSKVSLAGNAEVGLPEHRTFISNDPVSSNLVFYDMSTTIFKNGGQNVFLTNNAISQNSGIEDLSTLAQMYLSNLSQNLLLNSGGRSFVENGIRTSPAGNKHIAFAQNIGGIDVYGAELLVHFDQNGNMRAISGTHYPLKVNSKTANISLSSAISLGVSHLKNQAHYHDLESWEQELLGYNGPEATLIYLPVDKSLKLAYQITISPNLMETWQLFVSATDGEVLDAIELSCYLDGPKVSSKGTNLNNTQVNIGTYKQGDNYYLIDAGKSMFRPEASVFPDNPKGVIKTYNADRLTRDNLEFAKILSSKNNEFGLNTTEMAAVSAQANASIFYDKLMQVPFNFNSYDNAGSNITMYTCMYDPLQPTMGWENASWNGRVAFFGRGFTRYKAPLSKGLDVVSHELTHGLIEHATKIRKGTSVESNSLIEGICDIMAMIVDENFTIGENSSINKNKQPSGLIRNPSMPHCGQTSTGNWGANESNGYTADHIDEFINDIEAIHYNSTIVSHAFYLMTGDDENPGLGLKVSGELFFDVVTNYLGANPTFNDFKDALLLAVDIRFGAGSNYYNIIKKAFSNVGLETIKTEIKPTDLPALIGDNFILSNKVSNEINEKLSLFKIAESKEDEQFNDLSNLKYDASITDNGSLIYGIDSSNQVVKINYGNELDISYMDHELGSGYTQVAVSKNNERLALVKTETDTSIHIYDMEMGIFKKFKIYSHTTVRDGENFYELKPLRVGAMEWDYYGTKLIFEFENTFTDKQGAQHSVWNIGEIEVWDSTMQAYTNGTMHTFYDQISSDLDLRYPAFAKNSPNLFVHDVYDKRHNYNTVVAWDRRENVATKTDIMRTQIPAHASYTNTDSGLVVTDLDENGEPTLFIVQLKSDKVTLKNGMTPLKILSERKNPKWFTLGVRTNVDPAPAPKQQKLDIYPNPASDKLYFTAPAGHTQFAVYSLIGTELIRGNLSKQQYIDISQLATGQYIIRISSESSVLTNTFIKE
ncbi:T9SS type A sorting domain-containing protein [bacterium]|nr:T9SS type A sorting domain-containing protein [bacterium]